MPANKNTQKKVKNTNNKKGTKQSDKKEKNNSKGGCAAICLAPLLLL